MRIKWFSFVRVTGLLLVLLYHFFQRAFPGGFIGVDVFFTFSGYLITALLIDEFARNKMIDLLGFLRRRFYRIVPPVVIMVLVVLPFTFLIRKDFVADIGRQIASVLGFTTNLYEIFTGSSYESQFIPHLFVHTWSLAIEVHFYLFWGILVWFLSKKVKDPTQFRGLIFLISVGLFLLSFFTMFARAFFVNSFSTIYFSTLSHIFPFFLGAIFATMSGISETTKRFKKNVQLWQTKRVVFFMVGSAALLFLLGFILDFNNIITYLFGFALASLFTAVMVYSSRVLNDQTPHLQEPAFVTYLADISYGVYLFHWPFYIIFGQLMNNWLAVIFTVLFSLTFATISYYVVEPYIAGKQAVLFGLTVPIEHYKKWFYSLVGLLTVVTLGIAFTAPSVGSFETGLLVDALNQADNNMNRTHTLAAGDASAISDITVIGDSVALRSSTAFSELLPEAQVDAAVSRNFGNAYDIFKNHIDNSTLSKTVVLAVGVNSVEGYKDNIQQFIDNLPDGHRLIIVTPYNTKDERIPDVRDYELDLAKKYQFVTIADWYQAAVAHPEIWTESDGVHYNDSSDEGAKLYVETIKKAIQTSAKQPAKGEKQP
ncbi:acetyltransferase [Streptococcus mutans]|uniref:acyltransferase family protein n=1 Tax=Streptococcus mutans TaxID=1309 RepID=UPI0002B5CBB1|nr:acyltransferase family protein [Streptococcus mutans]EMC50284.1 putative acyltransferase [Streptococcus mutans S1B]KZM63130.1 acyltransferase [Streptococcus mutans]MDT9521725.1 acetyltransferase [Streptococcus mutans]MDT9553313.1 acetyltransferase [Streptococcus mutans]MDT9562706.1 acetyltransferase [Streptococcus mutans]